MMLKLGLIGISEGNGHPYSWSAIFNGYNAQAMDDCGFPVIPRYLAQQKWPESRIPNSEVVSIWTQDSNLSKKVSRASYIKNVVNRPEQMIGQIDALLLARDDAENHLQFVEPFLAAGIPVYIDKPVALSMQDFEKLYSIERYPGQIFTCSALRFSQELKLTDDERARLGEIRQIIASTPKSWNKYAVHIIEPVLNILPAGDYTKNHTRIRNTAGGSPAGLSINWNSGIQTNFFATGEAMAPISVRIIGTKGWKDLTFTDSFSAFKAALEHFVSGINTGAVLSPKIFNAQVVKILENGKP